MLLGMLLITKLREERRWSKLELARRSKYPPGDLSRVESGRLRPYKVQLNRLARALGVSVERAPSLLDEVPAGDEPSSAA